MVRAPCCEKVGLKKGPWTQEEDQILLAYIQNHGHDNWRKLPKKAGLLRCGKSCRLRWINYLKPDIKRGNFSKEEEDTIIKLHQQLGNRWSAIAAKLPGRTDNEIKNVWHTNLKKLVKPVSPKDKNSKRRTRRIAKAAKSTAKPTKGQPLVSTAKVASELEQLGHQPMLDDSITAPVTPADCSSSGISLSAGNSSSLTVEAADHRVVPLNEDFMESFEEFPEIDQSFWSEIFPLDDNISSVKDQPTASSSDLFSELVSSSIDQNCEELKDFWLQVFMEAEGCFNCLQICKKKEEEFNSTRNKDDKVSIGHHQD